MESSVAEPICTTATNESSRVASNHGLDNSDREESNRNPSSSIINSNRSAGLGPSFDALRSLINPLGRGYLTIINKSFPAILHLERHTASPHARLTTQVIMGQISTFPQMLAQECLPPFIYPRCVVDNKLPAACAASGIHSCLPRPLAICASVVGMFGARTSQSSQFVWKTVYSELRRLIEEVWIPLDFASYT